MLDIEKLRQSREQAFDDWFEKWWEKEDLEKKIEEANQEGYTNLVVCLGNYNMDDQIWMRRRIFLSKLQDMLPDFGVNFKYSKNPLTLNNYLSGIRIDWENTKSEDL